MSEAAKVSGALLIEKLDELIVINTKIFEQLQELNTKQTTSQKILLRIMKGEGSPVGQSQPMIPQQQVPGQPPRQPIPPRPNKNRVSGIEEPQWVGDPKPLPPGALGQ